MEHFNDRTQAGALLAQAVISYKNDPSAIVLALPRGGVIVALEVVQQLGLPLDLLVVRKLGAPLDPELAVGALTQNGQIIWDEALAKSYHLDKVALAHTIEDELSEISRRLARYRAGRSPLDLTGKTAIIVDDGIATGLTMRAAIISARALHAQKIVVAVPVGALDALREMEGNVDQIVCLAMPRFMTGISQFYDSFEQVSDEEVIEAMKRLQQK